MTKQIRLLLLAFGLGLFSVTVHASCDTCDQDDSPDETNCPPGGPTDPSGSMAEDVIVDDTAQSAEKPAIQSPADKAPATPPQKAVPASE